MSGIFGIVSQSNCYESLLYGTDYHCHLGTEYGGVAVFGRELHRQIHEINHSQFKSKFFEHYQPIEGNKGIGCVSSSDRQPIYLQSHLGKFCVVTMGLIENASELAAELLHQGVSFAEMGGKGVNSTELVAKIISQGKDIVDGIERAFSLIRGSCSLLLLSAEGIYAARDRLGYTSLSIGKRNDDWAVASETTAFPNNHFRQVKDLGPGEIVLLTEQGMYQKKAADEQEQICSFLWIYTGFPASSYDGLNAEVVRENCGRALARRDQDIEADLVTGVPDSGVAHAVGYAMESGKPFRRPLVKFTPGYGRSYTPPVQETRDLVAKMKLVPIREIIKDNRIVVCEDSIVRGTQLKNFTVQKLWEAGVREIHVRPACPPLMFPCRFNLSTRSIHELIARRAIRDIEGHDIEDVSEYVDHRTEKYQQMVNWISNYLEVSTLRYQTIDDMVEAIGLPREKLCLYCWNGQCCANKQATK